MFIAAALLDGDQLADVLHMSVIWSIADHLKESQTTTLVFRLKPLKESSKETIFCDSCSRRSRLRAHRAADVVTKLLVLVRGRVRHRRVVDLVRDDQLSLETEDQQV